MAASDCLGVCLRREYNEALALGAVAVAGNYAAVVNEGNKPHYGGSWASLAVFDLRAGIAVVGMR
jgi:hypothetical protein